MKLTPPLLDHGFAALRDMRDRIDVIFAEIGEAARAYTLMWLRPAEHLARLLLYVLARGLALGPMKLRKVVKREARAGARGFLFALSGPGGSTSRGRYSRRRVYDRPQPVLAWDEQMFRDLEEAELRAQGRIVIPRRAPVAPPPPAPVAPRPLAERIAALVRVLEAPLRLARRIARRLGAASVARLLCPRRVTLDTPCTETTFRVHDVAWALAYQDSS